jgi:anthranilate phosphoribosyltransferase
MRKALCRKTIFNYVGPLLNPAQVKKQVIGVSDARMAPILGKALMQFGSERVVVVHGLDGLDEASISGPSEIYIFEKGKEAEKIQLNPPKVFDVATVRGGEPAENAKRTLKILQGRGTEAENLFVALNSALALYVAGRTKTIDEGIALAEEILKSGAGYQKLHDVIAITNKNTIYATVQ